MVNELNWFQSKVCELFNIPYEQPATETKVPTVKFWKAYQNQEYLKQRCKDFLQVPNEKQQASLEMIRDHIFKGEQSIRVKNNLFNEHFRPSERYLLDGEQDHGRNEYWESLDECIFIMNQIVFDQDIKCYDCDTYSLFKYYLIPELDLHICKANGTLHMNNIYKNQSDRFMIVESTCLPYLQKENYLTDQYYVEHICAFNEREEYKVVFERSVKNTK